MAGAAETLTLDGFIQWAERTGRNLQHLDFRPTFAKIKVLMRASILANFASGTSPDGTSWPPLKRPRLNSRGNDLPLRDKGLLMAASTGGASYSEEITESSLTMTNNLEYAAAHQYGANILIPEKVVAPGDKVMRWFSGDGEPIFRRRTKAHNVTIPQRQFMGFKDSDVEKIGLIFAEDLGEQL